MVNENTPTIGATHTDGSSSAPVAIWKADVSGLQAWYDQLRASGVTDIRSYLESDSDHVLYGLHLVKVRQVNRESVQLFQARDVQHLLENAPLVMATVPLSTLIDVLVARWENQVSLCLETRLLTLEGNQLYGLVGISVPVEDERLDLSRIVMTFADVTDRKRTEEALRESMERMQLVMLASRTGWWDWNLRTNVLNVDDQCKSLLGVSPETEVTIELFRERLRPEDRRQIDEVLEAALARPGDYDVECAARWPDGSVHWAQLRGRSFHTPKGVPIRIMGVATDITARKQAEEALRQSEQWFRILAEAVPEIIFTRKPDGSCDYTNPRFYGYTGLSPTSINGAAWIRVLHPDDAQRVEEAWKASVSTGQPFESEYRMRAADGSYHWFLSRALPVRDAQGRIVKWFGTSVDVDQVKRMEEELADREALLRMSEEAGGVGSFEFNLETGRARISSQLLAIYGEKPGTVESTYDAWAKRVHPDDWEKIQSCVAAMLPEQPQWRCEYRIIRGDGEVRWLEARCRTEFDEQGRPVSVVGVNLDITERRRAEETLRESEEFHRTLIETLPVTVVLADPQGVIQYISPAAKKMFGLEPGQGLGTTPTDWIAPEHHDLVVQRMRKVLVELEPQPPTEYRMFRRDHSSVWAQLASAPVLDSEGRLKSVITVCQDVTDRKRAEEALAEREELLRLVLEASATGWWHWDLPSGQVTASPQAKALFELPSDAEVNFETFMRKLAPEEVSRVLEELPEALSSRWDFDSEFHLVWSDGSHHWVLARGRVLWDESGQAQRALGVIMDITERKRAEQELSKLNETLEQQVAERTATAERRASQLRILASELAEAEQRERRRLAKILHDHLQQILYAAKLKVGLLKRNLRDEAAAPLVRKTAELLDESIAESRSLAMALSPPILYDRGLVGALEWLAREFGEKHNLRVRLEIDPETEPNDEGTRVFLFEAVRELLLNVVKHAQAPSAHIRLTSLGERLQVVVSDPGQGFNAARLESRGTTAGFGLLSIRERLELLGGRMEINTAPGKGTQITLEVPRGQAVTPGERVREAVAVASSVALDTGQAPVQPASDQRVVRVLVADDHRVVREGLITVLQDQPEIQVVGEAADGQQAFELALYMKPDVILMDVTMPGMDGIEATRRVTEALPQVRVIGLSMHKHDDMATAMREAGAVDYLSKEIAADQLVSAVLAGTGRGK